MNDQSRWQAVLARDDTFDGDFVYAVRSTSVYCRPSCPSRRPGRRNVVFYRLPEAAERDGYRPCRRCQPRDANGRDSRVDVVRRACRYLDAQTDGVPTLAELGRNLGVSAHHLQRTFKAVMGITPRQYSDALRLERWKKRLGDGKNVTAALYDAGFGSSSRLYERAPSHLGMTPGTYRRAGQGTRIRYSVSESPLGWLLVAATRRGICSIQLGDDEDGLVEALRGEYSAAKVGADNQGLKSWVDAILRHLDGREPHLDLPTDIRATAFQRQVWELLCRIPYGETRSYSELARAMGKPRAARAVGRACATNPVPLLIPCHRAVRADGGLGGYGFGLERKRALLDRERAAVERLRS